MSAGALQYAEGNYYCFEPDRRVYLLSYDDGSCSILSDIYSSDYGYGTASQQLYDWYVTEKRPGPASVLHRLDGAAEQRHGQRQFPRPALYRPGLVLLHPPLRLDTD